MIQPSTPSDPTPSRPGALQIAALALLLACVPACFMVNYGDFVTVADAGPDTSTTDLDAENPNTTIDSETGTEPPDADPAQDIDGSTQPDAADSPDSSMGGSDAGPAGSDASTGDAGKDASTDAGRDGGMDGGDAQLDAEAGTDGASDGGDMDVRETGALPDSAIDAGDASLPCPAAGCTQTCPAGMICPFTCAGGTSCRFDCRAALACNVVCQTGSVCEVFSDVGNQDTVACQGEAKCKRVCDDVIAGKCLFGTCDKGYSSCLDGTQRCNWICL